MTMFDRPGQEAGTELRPVGVAAREVGVLREHIDRAIQRGQIPCSRVDGVRVIKIAHARAVKAWRAGEFKSYDEYKRAVQ